MAAFPNPSRMAMLSCLALMSILFVGSIAFNPATPPSGTVTNNPKLTVDVALGLTSVAGKYPVLLNNYGKYEVGQMIADLGYPNIIKPLVKNVTFRKNIIADSEKPGTARPIMRIYGDVWTTGNDVTRYELHSADNVYYRKNNDYYFFDGDSSITYTSTADLNVWKNNVGETGSIIPSSPSTLLNIMQNPSLPKDDPKSYLRTSSSEANALQAGASIDFTQTPWTRWFPEACSTNGATRSCTITEYSQTHSGLQTCTASKWSECIATDYTEEQICAGAAMDGNHCFFIDPVYGNDATGTGRMAAPWKSLSTVFRISDDYPSKVNLNSGSGKKTVVLRGGTFNVCQTGATSICINIDGTSNLIVRNYPNEHPKIVAPTNVNFAYPNVLIKVGSWTGTASNNIIFDGLDLQGGSSYVFKFSDYVSYVTLRNCKVHDSGIDVIASKGRSWDVG
ncbi:MAG: hypothetical protein V1835_00805, partial [Candidatus Micrarchaeota archaeon]